MWTLSSTKILYDRSGDRRDSACDIRHTEHDPMEKKVLYWLAVVYGFMPLRFGWWLVIVDGVEHEMLQISAVEKNYEMNYFSENGECKRWRILVSMHCKSLNHLTGTAKPEPPPLPPNFRAQFFLNLISKTGSSFEMRTSFYRTALEKPYDGVWDVSQLLR